MRGVERTLLLLDALSEQRESVGVVQLGERLAVPASTLHRLLTVLVRYGMVVQDPGSRRYRMGPGVLRLAKGYLQQNSLVSAAQPYLADLRSRTQETVFLTALVGEDAVCVATAESPRPLQFFMRVGQRMPFHAAASARAILAFRSRTEAERLLRRETFDQFTDSTPRNVDEALRELAHIRGQGYADCVEEMEVGVTAISAPIRDAVGEVVASATIVAPAVRLASSSKREDALGRLREATAGISAALGFQAAMTPDGDGAATARAPLPSAAGARRG